MAEYNLGTAKGVIDVQYNGKGVDQAKEDLDGLSKKSAPEAGKSLEGAANKAGVAGLAIAAGIGVAVKSASDFEYRMSQVKAVAGASAAEMDQLRDKALKLGAETSFSAGEAAIAIEELIKAGLGVPDVLNGAADATVALAAAGEIALPEAATISAAALNQFKLQAKDLPGVANLLAGAANASATGVSEVGAALQYVGPVAHAAGMSIEDTAIAISLLANNGIDGQKAGTSLRAILASLQPASKKARNAMHDLGLITEDGKNKFYTASGELKSMEEIVQILGGAFGGLTEEQKIAYATTIFGRESLAAVTAIAGTTKDEFNSLTDAIKSTDAAEVAATRMDNLSGSFEEMGGSLETAAIQMGSLLLPAIRSVVDAITGLVNWFTGLSENTQRTILGLAMWASGALIFVSAVYKINKAVKAFRASMIALNLAMKANPMLFIISAIIILIGLFITLYKSNDQFRAVVDKVWGAIKKAIGAVVDWITGTMWPAIKGAWDAIVGAAKTVWSKLSSIWNAVVSVISTVVGAIVGFFQSLWNSIVSIWNTISGVVMGAVNFILGIIRAYVKMWVTIITTVFNTLKGWWEAFWSVFGKPIKAIWDFIVALVRFVTKAIKFAIQSAMFAIKVIWDKVWGGIKDTVSKILSWVMNYITTGWNRLKSVTTTVWNAIKSFFGSIWNGIKSVVSSVADWIKARITTIWNGIKSVTSSVWNAIKNALSGPFNAVKGVVSGVVNNVKSAITNAWNTVSSKTKEIWNGLKNTVGNAINTVMDKVNGIRNKITGVFSGAGRWLLDAGKKIIQGLIDGITNMVKPLTDKLNGLTKLIPDKKGPPRKDRILLQPAGESIMDGLIRGLVSRLPALRSLLGDITLDVPKTLATAPVALADSASRTASVATRDSLSRLASGLESGAGGGINVDVDVTAPQNMSPDQVGRAVASRIGYALSGYTTPIPTPVGAV